METTPHLSLRQHFEEKKRFKFIFEDYPEASKDIADFFLSAFSTSVEEKIKELEGEKKIGIETKIADDGEVESMTCKECGGYDECDCEGFNAGIDLAISMCRELLVNLK